MRGKARLAMALAVALVIGVGLSGCSLQELLPGARQAAEEAARSAAAERQAAARAAAAQRAAEAAAQARRDAQAAARAASERAAQARIANGAAVSAASTLLATVSPGVVTGAQLTTLAAETAARLDPAGGVGTVDLRTRLLAVTETPAWQRLRSISLGSLKISRLDPFCSTTVDLLTTNDPKNLATGMQAFAANTLSLATPQALRFRQTFTDLEAAFDAYDPSIVGSDRNLTKTLLAMLVEQVYCE